ncbi:hypothetical protein AbraIFM66950_003122 [Aspergillus brasiliensis]|nr:hypothetical protein AbraIFM66950_003122 [Aspergillus brasiliensis]
MNHHTLAIRRIQPLRSLRRQPPRRNLSSTPRNAEPHPEKHHSPSNNPQPTPTVPGPVASTAAAPGSVSASRALIQRIQAGPVGRVARAYARVQERRPYRTQVISTIVVYLCGDLGAQLLFPPDNGSSREVQTCEQKVEAAGSSNAGGVGGGFMFLHNNFNFSSKFLSILTKVCVQQAVFTPVFNTYFFGLQSLMTGKSLEETFERLKVALPTSISNSVKLWPAVTAFSFMYVAPQFRSIFSGVIAVGWQTYLSWLNQKAAREVEAERTALVEVGAGVGAVAMKA